MQTETPQQNVKTTKQKKLNMTKANNLKYQKKLQESTNLKNIFKSKKKQKQKSLKKQDDIIGKKIHVKNSLKKKV